MLFRSDLFGPLTIASLGGKKYCLVIVDDYSRYTWVFFFKKKSETQDTVIRFTNEIQHLYELKIMTIRSDNAIEFKNCTLDELLGDESLLSSLASSK